MGTGVSRRAAFARPHDDERLRARCYHRAQNRVSVDGHEQPPPGRLVGNPIANLGAGPHGPGHREGAVGVPGAACEPLILPVPLWAQPDHLRPRLWSPVEEFCQRLSRLIALVRCSFAAAGTARLRAARCRSQFRRARCTRLPVWARNCVAHAAVLHLEAAVGACRGGLDVAL